MAQTSDASTIKACEWCGLVHTTKCPQIKSVEYHPDGSVRRYEFFGPKDYPPLTAISPDWRPGNYPTT